MRSNHSPWLTNTIVADDTGALECPHFTNREWKSVIDKHKVRFTPWLVEDVARGKKTYVYCVTGRHKKGANRWCTNMYHVIKALKTSGAKAAQAQQLILIGDNFSGIHSI